MRNHSVQLESVLTGSFNYKLVCDVLHGTDRVAEDVPVSKWSIRGDLSADVKHSGDLTLIYPSVDGESLIPTGDEGILSPFQARVHVSMVISAGNFEEKVLLGVFRVTTINDAEDAVSTFEGTRIVTATRIRVGFQSLETGVKRRGFRSPEQPPDLSSAWNEIIRITNMPVTKNLSDIGIPTTITYEAKEGGRLAGVQLLFSLMGGTGIIDQYGSWTGVPDVWGSPVGTLTIGEDGTIVSYPINTIETDEVYNVVVGTFEEPNTRRPIYAVATAPAGSRLDPDGAYGEYTKYITDQTITSDAAANIRVQQELDKIMASRRYVVDIKCVVNPTIDIGDILTVNSDTGSISGRVVKFAITEGSLMDVSLEVKRVY